MLDFLEWDCYFCKNYKGVEKNSLDNPKKRICLAYPDGIPKEILNVSKEEGKICNNGIGFIEKSSKRKERKREIGKLDKIVKKLFEDDVTIGLVKRCLKSGGFLKLNAIRSLIYNNLVDEEIISILKELAVNDTKRIFFCHSVSDFATAALHILGYKEIPLTYFSKRLFDYKDDIFTKFD